MLIRTLRNLKIPAKRILVRTNRFGDGLHIHYDWDILFRSKLYLIVGSIGSDHGLLYEHWIWNHPFYFLCYGNLKSWINQQCHTESIFHLGVMNASILNVVRKRSSSYYPACMGISSTFLAGNTFQWHVPNVAILKILLKVICTVYQPNGNVVISTEIH